jgi:hypothetical protein
MVHAIFTRPPVSVSLKLKFRQLFSCIEAAPYDGKPELTQRFCFRDCSHRSASLAR